jgi:solute carrier family 25 ornithine transporter 2/15
MFRFLFKENGVLFLAYGQCQNLICSLNNKTHNEQLTSIENMAAGSLAAGFSSLALCPTELVKCRIQTMNEMTMNKDIQVRKRM